MKDKREYLLRLNEDQADAVIKALNFFMRVNMGQFNEIADLFIGKLNVDAFLEAKDLLDGVRKAFFPELDANAFYGIGGPKTPQDAKICYDIYQVIRHRLSWDRNPKGGITVNYDSPLPVSGEPLAHMTGIKL